MKRILLIILFLFCCSCRNNPEDGTNQGKIVNDNAPQRIISLSPAITEELYLLGAEDRLIANTFYCKRPEAAMHKKKVGNLMNFNIENVLELKPDLILTTSLANRNKINKLRQLKIKVVELRHPKSFNEICDNFIELGKAIGSEKKAEQILAGIQQQVDNIKKITGNLPKKKVFIQIGAKPLKAVNSDYHINDLIRLSGGINIYEDSALNSFSRESVLLSNPDIIIIPSMGFATDEEKRTWEKYKSINAVKNQNIFIVDTEVFCNFGISTFMEALKISLSLLHPEVRLNN
ncbi:MAG: ABC transporter substrate-binding protein [Spirochaetes bacterium]|nr:ABC transporter substrate-binding protein [Spirochaetota bacterium]